MIDEYEKDEELFRNVLKGKISFEDDSKWNLTPEEKKLIIQRSTEYLIKKKNTEKE